MKEFGVERRIVPAIAEAAEDDDQGCRECQYDRYPAVHAIPLQESGPERPGGMPT
jgi:hypothetical protein